MKKFVLVVVLAFAFVVTSTIAVAGEKGGAKVVGIQIAAQPYDGDAWMMKPFNSRGTSVAVLIQQPGAAIVSFDANKSKLETFTDSTGKDLTAKPDTKSPTFMHSHFARSHVSKDRHAVLVHISGASTPAADATSVHVKGTARLKVAREKKTAVQKGAKLEKDAKITAGPVEFTLDKVKSTKKGKTRKIIELKATQEIGQIENIRFLDGEGNEIKSRGRRTSTMRSGNNVTVSKRFGLEKDVDTATVEIKYWGKFETKTIPIKLKAGIGL